MSTWDRIASTKVLRVGAVAGAPPNYQKNLVTGEWSGIMVDLAKDLAAKLNVRLEITETTWGNSVLDLQTNKLDIFFGLNPTPQRQDPSISIDVGQTEATWTLGMMPPLMNQSIMQLKNTSLVSVLALPDLVYQGQAVVHEAYRPLETYTLIAVMYLAVLLPITYLVKKFENRVSA